MYCASCRRRTRFSARISLDEAEEQDAQSQDVRDDSDDCSRELQHALIMPESARVCRRRTPTTCGANYCGPQTPQRASRSSYRFGSRYSTSLFQARLIQRLNIRATSQFVPAAHAAQCSAWVRLSTLIGLTGSVIPSSANSSATAFALNGSTPRATHSPQYRPTTENTSDSEEPMRKSRFTSEQIVAILQGAERTSVA